LADNENNWALLAGPPAGLNAKRHAQLRLEAIDTLETHFQNQHQPLDLAKKAMDHLLVLLGITGVVWNQEGTMGVAADDGTAGYILSREVEHNRRPVSFAFAVVPAEPDGTSLHVDPSLLGPQCPARRLARRQIKYRLRCHRHGVDHVRQCDPPEAVPAAPRLSRGRRSGAGLRGVSRAIGGSGVDHLDGEFGALR
jgi:hypothetical protein